MWNKEWFNTIWWEVWQSDIISASEQSRADLTSVNSKVSGCQVIFMPHRPCQVPECCTLVLFKLHLPEHTLSPRASGLRLEVDHRITQIFPSIIDEIKRCKFHMDKFQIISPFICPLAMLVTFSVLLSISDWRSTKQMWGQVCDTNKRTTQQCGLAPMSQESSLRNVNIFCNDDIVEIC